MLKIIKAIRDLYFEASNTKIKIINVIGRLDKNYALSEDCLKEILRQEELRLKASREIKRFIDDKSFQLLAVTTVTATAIFVYALNNHEGISDPLLCFSSTQTVMNLIAIMLFISIVRPAVYITSVCITDRVNKEWRINGLDQETNQCTLVDIYQLQINEIIALSKYNKIKNGAKGLLLRYGILCVTVAPLILIILSYSIELIFPGNLHYFRNLYN